MGNESGEWIMHGMKWDNPECIHSVDEAIKYINELGFLPLFKNDIDGFSLEYGWDVAVYSSIEHIYGYDYVTSCYKDNPQDSWKQLVDYMRKMYPEATDKQIRKILK